MTEKDSFWAEKTGGVVRSHVCGMTGGPSRIAGGGGGARTTATLHFASRDPAAPAPALPSIRGIGPTPHSGEITMRRVASISTIVLALVSLWLGTSVWVARGASGYGRQYYDTTWTYSSSYGYYYTTYYYQTYVTSTTYSYHYCIYYPSQPSYIYYYNPSTAAYWGRYEVGSKGDKRYSLLAEKDRKKEVKDIPNSAFPEAGKMPPIPGSDDKVAMEPPPEKTLPKAKPATDLPKEKSKD
jgi:hypothetical protein